MASGAGTRCLQILVVLFNITFFVTGVLLVVVALWTMAEGTFQEPILIKGDNARDQKIINALIIGGSGAVLLLFSLLGAGLTVSGSSSATLSYFVLLCLILGSIGAAGVAAALNKDKVKSWFESVTSDCAGKYYKTSSCRIYMDIVQLSLSCCGSSNFAGLAAWATYGGDVPVTCDQKFRPKEKGLGAFFDAWRPGVDGCNTKIGQFIDENNDLFIKLFIGFIAFAVILLALALVLVCCVWNNRNHSGYTQAAYY